MAASAAPSVPPAPGLLSTTTLVPSAGPSFSATRRATMSVPLPAVKGTTSLIGCVPGQGPCAWTVPSAQQPSSDAAAAASVCRRLQVGVFFMASCLRWICISVGDE
ncbi:hypothetical protein M2165_002060 [Variovorax sp. TBS-050B]|uniref:hypothetical protein n=1 Tax=Variovorax sp. TBS-050B TaxID=2940551 RepID=UPI0024755581|nr:hypothetical protein [Variovorax sp. TBS-050B]MDH6592171.1 hypothetical protein [Variovorax sp. TBS-050B]